MKPIVRCLLAAALIHGKSLVVFGDDWPQWRGPNRDGHWQETGIVDSIPRGGFPVRWRSRILNGWSGPAVASGRVYVTDHDYKSDPEVERILCLSGTTGQLLWMHQYPCVYGDMEYGNGPRATPTVHDGLVYTLGTKGHVTCLSAETGELRWKKDPVQDMNAQVPRYGASIAPLVVGDLVIVSVGAQPDGTLMAFDRKTGAERWRALADRPGYSAPILVETAGKQQVILWTGDNINSVDPATGELLWRVPYRATFDPAQATATPVLHKDKMLCLAAWNRGSMMLQLDTEKPGASVFWKTRSQPTASINTPVFRDDKYIYTVVGDGALCCLDPATGDEIWNTRAATSEHMGNAHIVSNGDGFFLLNQQGHLIAARLTPEGYHESGRMLLVEPTAGYRAAGPVVWAHPAFADKHVFARNDRELICVSLAAADAASAATLEPSTIEAATVPGTSGVDEHQTLSVAISPDGSAFAMGSGWGMVKQIELTTGAVRPSAKRHHDWVCAVTYSSDGKYLVSAGGSEFAPERNGGKTSAEIKVWDIAAQAERGTLEGHSNKVFAAAFSPNGKLLATGGADRTIRLWDIEQMKELRVLAGHADAVSSLSWSRDGKTLASASWDKTVRLWDVEPGKELATLAGTDEEMLAVAFSPDGLSVAAGGSDWNVRLWEVPSGKPQATLKGHRGAVCAIAFAPDGKTLATGSGDETIRLWNLESHAAASTLRGHLSGVTCVAFTPSGNQLISGSLEGPVKLWTLHTK
jgi:outer membrane protein assembly factor BamB